MSSLTTKRLGGFSLVELMVAVSIIGVFATLALPRYRGFIAQARRGEAKSNLAHISMLQSIYKAEHWRNYYGAAMTSGNGIGNGAGGCDDPSTGDVGLNNKLGFAPDGCSELRYFYYLLHSQEEAVAYGASNAQGKYVYPDCSGGGATECGYGQGDVVKMSLNTGKPEVCRNIVKYCPTDVVGGVTPPPETPPCNTATQCCNSAGVAVAKPASCTGDWRGSHVIGCCQNPPATCTPSSAICCSGDTAVAIDASCTNWDTASCSCPATCSQETECTADPRGRWTAVIIDGAGNTQDACSCGPNRNWTFTTSPCEGKCSACTNTGTKNGCTGTGRSWSDTDCSCTCLAGFCCNVNSPVNITECPGSTWNSTTCSCNPIPPPTTCNTETECCNSAGSVQPRDTSCPATALWTGTYNAGVANKGCCQTPQGPAEPSTTCPRPASCPADTHDWNTTTCTCTPKSTTTPTPAPSTTCPRPAGCPADTHDWNTTTCTCTPKSTTIEETSPSTTCAPPSCCKTDGTKKTQREVCDALSDTVATWKHLAGDVHICKCKGDNKRWDYTANTCTGLCTSCARPSNCPAATHNWSDCACTQKSCPSSPTPSRPASCPEATHDFDASTCTCTKKPPCARPTDGTCPAATHNWDASTCTCTCNTLTACCKSDNTAFAKPTTGYGSCELWTGTHPNCCKCMVDGSTSWETKPVESCTGAKKWDSVTCSCIDEPQDPCKTTDNCCNGNTPVAKPSACTGTWIGTYDADDDNKRGCCSSCLKTCEYQACDDNVNSSPQTSCDCKCTDPAKAWEQTTPAATGLLPSLINSAANLLGAVQCSTAPSWDCVCPESDKIADCTAASSTWNTNTKTCDCSAGTWSYNTSTCEGECKVESTTCTKSETQCCDNGVAKSEQSVCGEMGSTASWDSADNQCECSNKDHTWNFNGYVNCTGTCSGPQITEAPGGGGGSTPPACTCNTVCPDISTLSDTDKEPLASTYTCNKHSLAKGIKTCSGDSSCATQNSNTESCPYDGTKEVTCDNVWPWNTTATLGTCTTKGNDIWQRTDTQSRSGIFTNPCPGTMLSCAGTKSETVACKCGNDTYKNMTISTARSKCLTEHGGTAFYPSASGSSVTCTCHIGALPEPKCNASSSPASYREMSVANARAACTGSFSTSTSGGSTTCTCTETTTHVYNLYINCLKDGRIAAFTNKSCSAIQTDLGGSLQNKQAIITALDGLKDDSDCTISSTDPQKRACTYHTSGSAPGVEVEGCCKLSVTE